jgi:hypothetical protein
LTFRREAIQGLLANINQHGKLRWERVAGKHWVIVQFTGDNWKVWRGTETPGGFTESAEFYTEDEAMHAYARELWSFYKQSRKEAQDGCEIEPL